MYNDADDDGDRVISSKYDHWKRLKPNIFDNKKLQKIYSCLFPGCDMSFI